MSGKIFWTVAIVLMGIAIHLSYILFVPIIEMREKLAALEEAAGKNRWSVLAPHEAYRLLGEADPHLLHAVCLVDLSGGPLRVSASIPATYWSLDLYTNRGDPIYTINDSAADSSQLSVVIDPREERLARVAQTGEPGEELFRISLGADTGLLVMRSQLVHPAARDRIVAELASSACGQEPV